MKLLATSKVEDEKRYSPMPPVMPVQDFAVVITTYRKTYVRGWRTWWKWRIASVSTKMELQLIAPAQVVYAVLREEVDNMARNTGDTTDQEAMEELRMLTGASSNDAALSAIRGLHEHVRRDVEELQSRQEGHTQDQPVTGRQAMGHGEER